MTCTSQLQTFHRPARLHQGTPVKTEAFPTPRNMQDLLMNPEPENFRESPEALRYRIQNEVITYSASTHKKIPLLKTVPPANMYAVAKDHDYSGDAEQIFLKEMNVEAIDQEAIVKIEEETRGEAATKASYQKWSDERTKRLQSSNFGKICKRTERTDSSNLAKRLTVRSDVTSKAIHHSRKYESAALKKFQEVTGKTVRQSGIVVDGKHPYLACSPYAAKNRQINAENVPYLEGSGPELTLKKNHDYMYQIQGQMAVCNKQSCIFIVYTLKDFKIMKIQRNDHIMISQMYYELKSFYNEHFRAALLERRLYHCSDGCSFKY